MGYSTEKEQLDYEKNMESELNKSDFGEED